MQQNTCSKILQCPTRLSKQRFVHKEWLLNHYNIFMIFPSKFFSFFLFCLIALIVFRQSDTQYCWLNGIIGCWVKHSSESEVKVFSLDGAHISLCWCLNLLYSSQHFFNMVLSLQSLFPHSRGFHCWDIRLDE